MIDNSNTVLPSGSHHSELAPRLVVVPLLGDPVDWWLRILAVGWVGPHAPDYA